MTKPSDCVIAFALPTSEEGFRWSAQQQHSDYVHRFLAGWDQYREVCMDLRHCIGECSNVGVQIVEEVKFAQWEILFRSRVVALFAHWVTATGTVSSLPDSIDTERELSKSRDVVELWDCRACIDDLVDGIPDSFEGVLDLSVCHPSTLVDKIKRHRRNCTVRYFPNELLPSVWAEMYIAVFSYLGQFGGNTTGGDSKNGADYCDVLEQVAREFRSQLGGKR
jgi:hypothetical protein